MLPFSLALIVGLAGSSQVSAGIIEDYPLGDFTLINTNADGLGLSGTSTLILIGPNNGTGLPGTTDLVTTAKTTGTIDFNYSYSTLDIWSPGDPDAPFDYAGYLIGSTFHQLADNDGQSGTASFAVTAGQTFGFRVASIDNSGEPGILTIMNAPNTSGVPEPGTWSLLLLGGAAVLGQARMRRALAKK